MDEDFLIALSEACEMLVDNTIADYEASYSVPKIMHSLNNHGAKTLANRILALPEEDFGVLFFHYYFNFDFYTISDLLDISNVQGRLHYINELLSHAMGYPSDTGINGDSFVKACGIAISQYVATALNDFVNLHPKYSKAFRKGLIPIRGIPKQPNLVTHYGKRAAAVILISGISLFSLTLAANAQLRDAVFSWVVEQYEKFSAFRSYGNEIAPLTNESYEILKAYTPEYLPDGYSLLHDPAYFFPGIYYDYENDEGSILSIIARIPTENEIYFDTEGVEIETTNINGMAAQTWESDGIRYLYWELDGYHFTIVAELGYDEALRIVHNIKK